MAFDAYLRYMLSEVNVDHAIARGACTADESRGWCRAALKLIFGDRELTVMIPGYVASLGAATPGIVGSPRSAHRQRRLRM